MHRLLEGPARRALLASSIAALTVTVSATAAGGDDDVHASLPLETYRLENGLEVILHPDHRIPIVAVEVCYHVGSKDDPPGRSGFAHLFEHMMIQGSRNVGEDEFFKILERAGATDRNAHTEPDLTRYMETVPSGALPLVLWLESDRMGFLLDHVNEKSFASQRDVVKNERRQHYENAPYGFVEEFVKAALFPPGHPYHLLTIGTPHDLDAASVGDVRAFFTRFYVPSNATLVLDGDFEPGAAKALVARYFATLPRGADPHAVATPVPVRLDAEKRLTVEADVELPRVVLAWPTAPAYTPEDAHLDLAAKVLAEGKSSRLYRRLVHDLQIAQEVTSGEDSRQLAGTFEIEVTLRKGKDPAEALRIVDEELGRLRAAPPTDDELLRARAPIVAWYVFRLENATSRAYLVGDLDHLAHDPGFLDRRLAQYEGARPRDIQAAAATWLPAAARVVTIVRPTSGAPRAGRLAGSTGP